jgi:hypothetical protein
MHSYNERKWLLLPSYVLVEVSFFNVAKIEKNDLNTATFRGRKKSA